jgi:hypothetical protein
MKQLTIVVLFLLMQSAVCAQKMLLLERRNSPKTTRYYLGSTLNYQYKSDRMWYPGQLADIQVDQQMLLMDQLLVPIDSIGALRMPKSPLARIAGGALFTFGASLTFASTIALLYGEKGYNYPLIYGGALASSGIGMVLMRPKSVKLGGKRRLRAIEVSFGQ